MPSDVQSCDYCPRWAVSTIYLRQNAVRVLLRLPRRVRRVCRDHVQRHARPVGRHG
jgi:hypothetical protein